MNLFTFSQKEKEQAEHTELLVESKQFDLVLFNDEVNTFEWVIECLINICEHDEIQAEQSAFIVHYKGQCTVKSGDWEVLEPMHRALSNCDLSVEIL